jgi:hypothetical protein
MDLAMSAGFVIIVLVTAAVVLPFVAFMSVVSLVWREPRLAIGMALFLLMATGVTSAVGWNGVAEQLAVCAYSFLALGVVLLLVCRSRGRSKEVGGEE